MIARFERRTFLTGFFVGGGASLFYSSATHANQAWANWNDLINFAPDHSALVDARRSRGRPPLDFEVQRIEKAKKPTVNLDRFAVKIEKFPTIDGARLTEIQFFNHIRKNLNNFFDNEIARLSSHLKDDQLEWDKSAMLGTIMLFHIKKWGLPVERGAVVVSKSTQRSWIFSPVKIGTGIIGTHPVAGNREFGIAPEGGGHVIYVRAADRPYDLTPTESVVFEGADALWKSFQERVAFFVNNNNGKASPVNPIIHRPAWRSVVDAGYFRG